MRSSSSEWPSSTTYPAVIAGLRDVFSSFKEPSKPIPPDVIALTGITNEIVAGYRIDEAAVSLFAEDAVTVIAHNAGFDRKLAVSGQSLGVFGDPDRMPKARLRGLAPPLPAERCRFLSPGSQGG